MPANPEKNEANALSASASVSEAFYSGALQRISKFMLAISLPLIAVAWWNFSWRVALGLGLGCLIAYVNFFWLKRAIAGFADRATGTATPGSGQGVVFRFLLRYVLMALGAYAILTVSPASLHGLLAGLFLPVGAILCEAVYELYAAMARGL